MNEFKGTQGPWYAWDNGENGKCGVGKLHSDEADILHAVSQSNRSRSEDMANMRLIAQAPYLLGIAKRLVALEGEWHPDRYESSKIELLNDAKLAIGRALGEKS